MNRPIPSTDELRRAFERVFARTDLHITFETALASPALTICLTNLARAPRAPKRRTKRRAVRC
jgi:hypothetical protein